MASGYDAFNDPYAYKGTETLKNRLGLRDPDALEAFELEMTTLRASEPLPAGDFGVGHYRRIHRHLFQDVYRWAGRNRTVRTAKDGNRFCHPEYLDAELSRLFEDVGGLIAAADTDSFIAGVARFLADLNAIHPFREGNGRVQLVFVALLAERTGFPLDFAKVRPCPFLVAMIDSFSGRLDPLISELGHLLR